MAIFDSTIIRKFNGLSNTIDGLIYTIHVNEYMFSIGCTDNPEDEEVEWDLVFVCYRHLKYETILEILKAYGFDTAPDWNIRVLF